MNHWKLYLSVAMAALAGLQHSVTGTGPMTSTQWVAAIISTLLAAGSAAMAYLDTTVADSK